MDVVHGGGIEIAIHGVIWAIVLGVAENVYHVFVEVKQHARLLSSMMIIFLIQIDVVVHYIGFGFSVLCDIERQL